MTRFKPHHKIIAIVLTVAFTFQSLSQINNHSYTTGVDNIHAYHQEIFSCLGSFTPIHMNYDCFHPLY